MRPTNNAVQPGCSARRMQRGFHHGLHDPVRFFIAVPATPTPPPVRRFHAAAFFVDRRSFFDRRPQHPTEAVPVLFDQFRSGRQHVDRRPVDGQAVTHPEREFPQVRDVLDDQQVEVAAALHGAPGRGAEQDDPVGTDRADDPPHDLGELRAVRRAVGVDPPGPVAGRVACISRLTPRRGDRVVGHGVSVVSPHCDAADRIASTPAGNRGVPLLSDKIRHGVSAMRRRAAAAGLPSLRRLPPGAGGSGPGAAGGSEAACGSRGAEAGAGPRPARTSELPRGDGRLALTDRNEYRRDQGRKAWERFLQALRDRQGADGDREG